jgi:hypothetical protein
MTNHSHRRLWTILAILLGATFIALWLGLFSAPYIALDVLAQPTYPRATHIPTVPTLEPTPYPLPPVMLWPYPFLPRMEKGGL